MIELVKGNKQLTLNALYQKMSDSELDIYYKDLMEKQKNKYETQISDLNTEIDELEAQLEVISPDAVFNSFSSGGSATVFTNETITEAKPYLFANTQYTGLNLPNLRKVGGQCFYFMDNCEFIITPNLEEIEGSSIFMYNKALTSISLPKLDRLSQQMFYNCYALASVNLPGLINVGSGNFAFQNTAIQKFDMPEAMTSNIPSYFFNNCKNLETFILRSKTLCALSNINAFTGTLIASGTGYIYVPAALIETYKTATNWITYANQFRAIEDYPEICKEA